MGTTYLLSRTCDGMNDEFPIEKKIIEDHSSTLRGVFFGYSWIVLPTNVCYLGVNLYVRITNIFCQFLSYLHITNPVSNHSILYSLFAIALTIPALASYQLLAINGIAFPAFSFNVIYCLDHIMWADIVSQPYKASYNASLIFDATH
jgi:hypothetical protein